MTKSINHPAFLRSPLFPLTDHRAQISSNNGSSKCEISLPNVLKRCSVAYKLNFCDIN